MDNSYWDRFWSDPTLTPLDYFTLVTFQDIRDLRDKASGNLTALCFKVSLSLFPSLSPPMHPCTPPHIYNVHTTTLYEIALHIISDLILSIVIYAAC